MKTRKLVLIIADLVLLAVCIIQGIVSAGDGVKTFTYDGKPDEITIVTPSETILLTKENDNWFVSDSKYPVITSTVESLIEASSSIRALDKIASVNENNLTKYELTDGKKISVEIKKAGKILRSFSIGKDAASSSQSYITLDKGNDIYLASGSLRNTFDTSVDALRSKVIWDFDKNTISSLGVTKADGENWSLSRLVSGNSESWSFSVPDKEVDSAKAKNVLEALAYLTTSKWYDDDIKPHNLNGELLLTAKVGHTFDTASIEIYKVDAATEDGETTYFAVSSESPYVFELSSYNVEKFNKNAEDFIK